MSRKGGKGRKSLPMEKIENESHLNVTFSKRWVGFFKKLSEVCIRCDVEAASMLVSPTNKVYSFGHPSLAKTMNKYRTMTNGDNNPIDVMVESDPNLTVPGITQVEEDLSREKARGRRLDDLLKATENQYLWDIDDNDQNTLEQLEHLKVKLGEVYNDCELKELKFSFEANCVGEAGPSGL